MWMMKVVVHYGRVVSGAAASHGHGRLRTIVDGRRAARAVLWTVHGRERTRLERKELALLAHHRALLLLIVLG